MTAVEQRTAGATVPSLLEAAARATPLALAWCYRTSNGWYELSWREVWRSVEDQARALRAMGIARGDRVALWASTSHRAELSFHAALLAGATVVGIDPSASSSGALEILQKARVRALLVDAEDRIAAMPAGWDRELYFVATLEQRKATAGRLPRLGEGARADVCGAPQPTDPAIMIHTSGTTGTPKAIVYRHEQLVFAAHEVVRAFEPFGRRDRSIAWLPLSALFQRMVNLVCAAVSACIYFVEDPRDLLRELPVVKPSLFVGVPRVYEKLARRLVECAKTSSTERAVEEVLGATPRKAVSGSAPLSSAAMATLASFGVTVLEAYGVSENVVPIAMNRSGAFRPGSVGQPLAGNDVRISSGGEVLVRGKGVFSAYEIGGGGPGADGFYKTGDVGRFDAEHYLYLTGRTSEIIKTATGRRISPSQIEAQLRAAVDCEHAVVIGEGRPFLSALFTLPPAHALDGERARARIAAQLARVNASLPRYERIVAFDVLPSAFSVERGELTRSDKLRRQRIEERHRDRIERLYAEAMRQEATA